MDPIPSYQTQKPNNLNPGQYQLPKVPILKPIKEKCLMGIKTQNQPFLTAFGRT